MITLGLLSDTHGRAEMAQAGVLTLIEHGADVLIHLGDVGSPQVIDAMAVNHPDHGRQIESHLVFGNCDWERAALARYADDLGVRVHEPYGLLVIDDCKIGFAHGHEHRITQELLSGGVDFYLHGHTHVQDDRMAGQTRVINPGALFRASKHSVALLQPASGSLEVLEVASVVR